MLQERLYDVLDYPLVLSCASLWLVSYGLMIVSVELTNIWIFLGLSIGIGISYLTTNRFSLEKCSEEKVKEILGINFRLDPKKANDTLNEIVLDRDLKKIDAPLILKIVAHRFAGIDAPENSLKALHLCYQRGCVAVEFDVALTADKVPVVFHDNTVDRLTNTIGEISKMTWEKLQELDISVNHPFHERFKDTKIAQLDDVIEQCVNYDLRMFIDIKDSSAEIVELICRLFDRWPSLYKRAIVSSFNPLIVYLIREKRPNVVGGMAWRPHFFSYCKYSPLEEECKPYYNSPIPYLVSRIADIVTTWLFNNICYRFVGLSVVLIHKDCITHEVINLWQKRGIRVIAWTVNVPSEKLHFSRNLQIPYMTDTMAGD